MVILELEAGAALEAKAVFKANAVAPVFLSLTSGEKRVSLVCPLACCGTRAGGRLSVQSEAG